MHLPLKIMSHNNRAKTPLLFTIDIIVCTRGGSKWAARCQGHIVARNLITCQKIDLV